MQFDMAAVQRIMRAGKPADALRPVVFDTEVYRNYFLAAFLAIDTRQTITIEAVDGSLTPEDRALLERVLTRNMTVGFNSLNYDRVVAWMAVRGYPTSKIKVASDTIILGGAKPWEMEREYGLNIPRQNHVDLIEVAPGKASLKVYGGRLHAPLMQDLPFEPDAWLEPDEIDTLRAYCVNDLDTTERLFASLVPQLDLRASMSGEYGEDLRSKSDAQIAEAVIKKRVTDIRGRAPEKPKLKAGTAYRYRVPDFIGFGNSELAKLVEDIAAASFIVSGTGKIIEPECLKNPVTIGAGKYRLGIGGLHSSEEKTAHVSDDRYALIDRDVASYYPAIILNQGLTPKHLAPEFQPVYRQIVDRRLQAKATGNKVVAESLKITINGSFGKFGSQWSILCSPDLMIQTTITGQLALLMLIERLEAEGFEVVSANTDGIVMRVRVHDPEFDYYSCHDVVRDWEKATGFKTEATPYQALYSRDVNNYIAVKPGGEVKLKGAYAAGGLQKNPTNEIAVAAVIACLTKGTPVSETILACRDIRQFVTVRTVQGGAVQADKYLGKAIRWYYSKSSPGPILYKKNGNKVPRSDGSKALMNLPDDFPPDVDHVWYIAEAYAILKAIGYRGDIDPHFDIIFKE